MSPEIATETRALHGCALALRRVSGPRATELFFSCAPPLAEPDTGAQAQAVYRAAGDLLAAQGGARAIVLSEMVFLRDAGAEVGAVRDARARGLAGASANFAPAIPCAIEQPPVSGAALELLVHAWIPAEGAAEARDLPVASACDCPECAASTARVTRVGEALRVDAGALCGAGGDAHAQSRAMFERAERVLQQAGLAFGDVVRTWIHLRDIDRDYAALNRARREFFASRGVDPIPASTGIGGAPVGATHDVCLGLCAVRNEGPLERSVMHSPTLNEAPEYGADFVRGMRVVEANKIALHVSGTASVDETGATAHPGDFDRQAERMLVNIRALLAGQGAAFDDIVSAITYVKHLADAPRLRAHFEEAWFTGFAQVTVVADVCRPELLCETELLAVRPLGV